MDGAMCVLEPLQEIVKGKWSNEKKKIAWRDIPQRQIIPIEKKCEKIMIKTAAKEEIKGKGGDNVTV